MRPMLGETPISLGPLGHRDQHDDPHTDAADHEGDRRDHHQHPEADRAGRLRLKFNAERPHQGAGYVPIEPNPEDVTAAGKIVHRSRLGGRLSYYHRLAALALAKRAESSGRPQENSVGSVIVDVASDAVDRLIQPFSMPKSADLGAAVRVHHACLPPRRQRMVNFVIIPAVMWSFTWQCSIHVPGLSAVKSTVSVVAGAICTTSLRLS